MDKIEIFCEVGQLHDDVQLKSLRERINAEESLSSSVHLFIRGEGVIPDNAFSQIHLCTVRAEGVKKVGASAFYDCPWLEEVEFPLVEKIEQKAFAECRRLVIGRNWPKLEIIGIESFLGCRLPSGVAFPKVRIISDFAFREVRSSSSSTNHHRFPEVKTIGPGAFFKCKLKSVDFPKAKDIFDMAFAKCNRLVSAKFPMVRRIRDRAFEGCALREAHFPMAVTLHYTMFKANVALRVVSLPRYQPSNRPKRAHPIIIWMLEGCVGLRKLTLNKTQRFDEGYNPLDFCMSLNRVEGETVTYFKWEQENMDVFFAYHYALKLCVHCIDEETGKTRMIRRDEEGTDPRARPLSSEEATRQDVEELAKITRFMHEHEEPASVILSFFGTGCF